MGVALAVHGERQTPHPRSPRPTAQLDTRPDTARGCGGAARRASSSSGPAKKSTATEATPTVSRPSPRPEHRKKPPRSHAPRPGVHGAVVGRRRLPPGRARSLPRHRPAPGAPLAGSSCGPPLSQHFSHRHALPGAAAGGARHCGARATVGSGGAKPGQPPCLPVADVPHLPGPPPTAHQGLHLLCVRHHRRQHRAGHRR